MNPAPAAPARPAVPPAHLPGPHLPQLDPSARPVTKEHTVSRRVPNRRSRPTSEVGYYLQPAPAASRPAQRGGITGFVLWVIGWTVWIVLAALLTVVLMGAWRYSVPAGLGTTAFVLVVAYFMVRER
jgi:hypothetical protein